MWPFGKKHEHCWHYHNRTRECCHCGQTQVKQHLPIPGHGAYGPTSADKYIWANETWSEL